MSNMRSGFGVILFSPSPWDGYNDWTTQYALQILEGIYMGKKDNTSTTNKMHGNMKQGNKGPAGTWLRIWTFSPACSAFKSSLVIQASMFPTEYPWYWGGTISQRMWRGLDSLNILYSFSNTWVREIHKDEEVVVEAKGWRKAQNSEKKKYKSPSSSSPSSSSR